jgi:hypothetical protein
VVDNVTLNAGSGGDTIAADDDATAKHQYVKLEFGADGTFNKVTSTATNPLPVALSDVDNAVLDSIDTSLNNIETAQLADGHNVTVDNAAGASAVNIQDGGNSITVDGTITANLSATDNAVLDTIETNTDYGTVTGNGTATGALRVSIASDTTGVVSIDDNGASITVDGSVTADLGANNDVTVQGEVAHDAAASGAAPVILGGRATNSVEGLTQVANADASYIATDLNGVTLTRAHTTPEEHISERISNTNGTSTAFTNFAAGGAGVHNYVTDITVYNSSATDGYVDIRDGAAGSIIWTLPLPAAGGATHSFSLPLKGAANTALAYDVSAALTTVYISVNGFQAQG